MNDVSEKTKPIVSELEVKLQQRMRQPLQKNAGLFITVSRYFTDINGTLINKARAPASLQTTYPIWMFGQYDFAGGYRVANQVQRTSAFYVGTFVGGQELPFLFATGLNTIRNKYQLGDIIHVFTDNLDAPSAYAYVVQSCGSASLASIYRNAVDGNNTNIDITAVNYLAYANSLPVLQWGRDMRLVKLDVLGTYQYDVLNPLSYSQVSYPQSVMIQIPLKVKVNQYFMLTTSIDFTIDVVNFAFLLKKNTKPM